MDNDFKDFLIQNISKSKEFFDKHPEMSFELLVQIPNPVDKNEWIDISLWYKPNDNISKELKSQLSQKIINWYNSLPEKYKETIIDPSKEEEPWKRNCYGSQPLQLKYGEYLNLEAKWKAINRDKKIDEILND